MATRYVWEKFNRKSSNGGITGSTFSNYSKITKYGFNYSEIYFLYTDNPEAVSYELVGTNKNTLLTNYDMAGVEVSSKYSDVQCMKIDNDKTITVPKGRFFAFGNSNYSGISATKCWSRAMTVYDSSGSNLGNVPACCIALEDLTITMTYSGAKISFSGSFASVNYGTVYVQGTTSYGYLSGSSSSSYITGQSGSYWYVYKGSDCIDPTAVGYSKTTGLKGGESITVNVTSRSNTYGGTISYKYQYSTNGGSTWTNITTTTSTSQSVTIPKGATQFNVRVLASDNYGFTSSTYVTGTNLTNIKNDSVYVGVSGTIKSVSAVACVSGSIKTNIKMYQGVNGTVKQS